MQRAGEMKADVGVFTESQPQGRQDSRAEMASQCEWDARLQLDSWANLTEENERGKSRKLGREGASCQGCALGPPCSRCTNATDASQCYYDSPGMVWIWELAPWWAPWWAAWSLPLGFAANPCACIKSQLAHSHLLQPPSSPINSRIVYVQYNESIALTANCPSGGQMLTTSILFLGTRLWTPSFT